MINTACYQHTCIKTMKLISDSRLQLRVPPCVLLSSLLSLLSSVTLDFPYFVVTLTNLRDIGYLLGRMLRLSFSDVFLWLEWPVGRVWWPTLVVPTLEREKQKAEARGSIAGCIVSLMPTWST